LWDERLQLSREMCRAAHRLGDSAEVWLWIDAIGYMLRHRRQFSGCMQALKRGRLLARQFELDDAPILAGVFEARLYVSLGDMDLAQDKIDRVLEQVDLDSVFERDTLPVRRIVARRAVDTAARLNRLQQDYVREKEWCELDLRLRYLTGENPTPSLTRLADVSLRLNDLASAERFVSQALATAEQADMGWINYVLARVAEKKGEFQDARRFCVLALKHYARIEWEGAVQNCQELLARLPVE